MWHGESFHRLGFRVSKFLSSLLLYFHHMWLHCLSKVLESRSSCCLLLHPTQHLGSLPSMSLISKVIYKCDQVTFFLPLSFLFSLHKWSCTIFMTCKVLQGQTLTSSLNISLYFPFLIIYFQNVPFISIPKVHMGSLQNVVMNCEGSEIYLLAVQ
jgi:hypothetical protein